MNILRACVLAGLGLSLSACASVETPTRNTPFEDVPPGEVTAPEGYQQIEGSTSAGQVMPISVRKVTVDVPEELKVSEANLYYPGGDIVWREDPRGDRHEQVKKIFEASMAEGVKGMKGANRVDIDIEVRRFHALTEKARYTVGGVHSITFDLAIRDAKTGELITPVRTIRADLNAYGGQEAIDAEARGETQKVRITNHLAQVIRTELTSPGGHKNAQLGLIQALNRM